MVECQVLTVCRQSQIVLSHSLRVERQVLTVCRHSQMVLSRSLMVGGQVLTTSRHSQMALSHMLMVGRQVLTAGVTMVVLGSGPQTVRCQYLMVERAALPAKVR